MTDTKPTEPDDLYDAAALNVLAHDNSHSTAEDRLAAGLYLTDPQGHCLLVGSNKRALSVLDMYGVIQVGGVETRDPDLLEAFAERLHEVAARLRTRPEVAQ